MREASKPVVLGVKRKAVKWFLVLLYAFTFYLGPQIAGSSFEPVDSPAYAHKAGGPATGSYLINMFNANFEMSDL